MTIELIVLGSGQDGGVPQFGTTHSAADDRTASSVAILADDDVLLFDPSADLRRQWLDLRTLRPATGGLPRAVFVTHAHMGHYAGLLQFGKEAASTTSLPLVAPSSVIAFLASNEPWASLLADAHLVGHAIEGGPWIHAGVEVHGIPVPHRGEHSDTVGYSLRLDGRPWVLYLPDIDSWDRWSEAEATIEAHDVSLLDATFGSADELPDRDMRDIPHPLVTETIDRFGHLTTRRRLILTHINHTNPVGRAGSDLARAALDAGFEVATDGLVITS